MSRTVRIVDYDPRWPILYEEEKRRISEVIGHKVMAIEHIGSTAVPSLGGKPILDIMAGVCQSSDADVCVSLLQDDYKDVTPEPENPERTNVLRPPALGTVYERSLEETSPFS